MKCKCCSDVTVSLGAAPLIKAKEEAHLVSPIDQFEYQECGTCGFVMSYTLDSWSFESLKTHIYNEFYHLIDHGAPTRNQILATFFNELFGDYKNKLNVLDYGAGKENQFARCLKEKKFNVNSFDPFYDLDTNAEKKYDVITSFEVFEHHTSPRELISDLKSRLNSEGIIFFSTELVPDHFQQMKLNWWYINPRAGHVSIYSENALKTLLLSQGFEYFSLGKGLHMGVLGQPEFAKHAKRVSEYSLNSLVNFANPIHHFRYAKSGWSEAAKWGAWTVAETAEIQIELQRTPEKNLVLEMDCIPHLHRRFPILRVDVSVNELPLATFKFKFGKRVTVQKIVIPHGFIKKPPLLVKFTIRHPWAPSSVKKSDDHRLLGLGVKSFWMREEGVMPFFLKIKIMQKNVRNYFDWMKKRLVHWMRK
jgi:SAM-dependent methyltransferase